MKKPGKGGKRPRSAAEDAAALSRLRGVQAKRAPYLPLLRQTIAQTLASFLPQGDGRVAEIGSGDGQLREWLPEALLPRVVHTEPMKVAVREFEKRHPGVAIERAGAGQLPFADASLDAVIALAVLDVVDDAPSIAREIQRVLRPGGVLLHWLDMSTVLTGMFQVLAQGNWVALPNAVSDPSTVRFPEDLLLIPLPQLELVLQVLVAGRHPYAKPLRQYLELWRARPLAVRTVVLEFTQLAESVELRKVLRNLFKVAYELAPPAQKAAFESFQGQPAASSKFFEGRLREWFSAAQGFSVLCSEVITSFTTVPSSPAYPYPYMSLCVGEHRHLPGLPKVQLCEDAPPPAPGHSLVELGVFVFAARRE